MLMKDIACSCVSVPNLKLNFYSFYCPKRKNMLVRHHFIMIYDLNDLWEKLDMNEQ